MYRKILVPLDGSKVADKILPYVEGLVKCSGGRLILLRAIDRLPYVVTGVIGDIRIEDIELEREQAELYLFARQKDLAGKGIESEGVVLHGAAVQAIVETAESRDVDLIAMGSHGRGALSSVVYGSVVSAILHRVRRPLLLVRFDVEDE
jgi:nucleotide-binding universal stress UspA family protein